LFRWDLGILLLDGLHLTADVQLVLQDATGVLLITDYPRNWNWNWICSWRLVEFCVDRNCWFCFVQVGSRYLGFLPRRLKLPLTGPDGSAITVVTSLCLKNEFWFEIWYADHALVIYQCVRSIVLHVQKPLRTWDDVSGFLVSGQERDLDMCCGRFFSSAVWI
jgi:hypothetical protein